MVDSTLDALNPKVSPDDLDNVYLSAAEGDRRTNIANLKAIFGEQIKPFTAFGAVVPGTIPEPVIPLIPAAPQGNEALVGTTWTTDFQGTSGFQRHVFGLTVQGATTASQETITIEGVNVVIPIGSSQAVMEGLITAADYSLAVPAITSVQVGVQNPGEFYVNYVDQGFFSPTITTTNAGVISYFNDFTDVVDAQNVQYITTDYVWDQTSSIRFSMEFVEPLFSDQFHLMGLTTHPENFGSDVKEVFSDVGWQGTSGTELLMVWLVGHAPGGNFQGLAASVIAGNVNPQMVKQLPASPPVVIGATVEYYLALNLAQTDFLMGIRANGVEGITPPFPQNGDISGLVGSLKLCIGTASLKDDTVISTSFAQNYLAGSSDGVVGSEVNAFSAFPFETLPTYQSTPLALGIYESPVPQNISGVDLEIDDIFTIGTDNTTVTLVGSTVAPLAEQISNPPSYILYTPSVADSLNQHGNTPYNASKYKANSFEEAVEKSKINGRLPIVIDSNVLINTPGGDLTRPRIKSFNAAAISYYDLTNIVIYSWDAWHYQASDLFGSIDEGIEDTIAVDQGVTLRYSQEVTSVFTDYADNLSVGGGKQVHGFIGFGTFAQTNISFDNDTPDPGNHQRVDNFIELHANSPTFLTNNEATFVLHSKTLNNMDLPTAPANAEHVYAEKFIQVTPQEIGVIGVSKVIIDIKTEDFSNEAIPIELVAGAFVWSAIKTQSLHIQAELVNSPHHLFDGNSKEGLVGAINFNSVIGIELDSFVSETYGLILEAKNNTTLRVHGVKPDSTPWQGMQKRGVGRLDFVNFVGFPAAMTVNSKCSRLESGVTWQQVPLAALTVNHDDLTEAYVLPNDLSVNSLVVANGLDVQGEVSTSAAQFLFPNNSPGGQGLFSLTKHVNHIQANPTSSVTLTDSFVTGKSIEQIIINDNNNVLDVYAAAGHTIDGKGTLVASPVPGNTNVRFVQTTNTTWVSEVMTSLP